MKEAADRVGDGDRFQPLELAVSFDPDWNYELPDPHDAAQSKTFVNAQGSEQGTCVHLGNCDIGCDVARATRSTSTTSRCAEQHGAEVRPLHLVRPSSRSRTAIASLRPDRGRRAGTGAADRRGS